jgi:5'-3' exonuclease
MPRLLIDGMSVFKTLNGQAAHLDRGYAYSFLIQVASAVAKLEPQGVTACWEGGFEERTALLPDYKSNRTGSGELVVSQRYEVQRLLTLLGVDQCYAPGHEADDAVAYLANTLPQGAIIVSADKDMLQLVRPGVSVYQKVRGAGLKSNREIINHRNFQEKTTWLNPQVFLEAHCALGDAVDKIPKVPGVGAPLIHLYHSGGVLPEAKRKKLDVFYADSPQYLLNKQLIDLTKTTELALEVTPGAYNEAAAYNLLLELGFNSIAGRFDKWIVPWEKATANADVPAV